MNEILEKDIYIVVTNQECCYYVFLFKKSYRHAAFVQPFYGNDSGNRGGGTITFFVRYGSRAYGRRYRQGFV